MSEILQDENATPDDSDDSRDRKPDESEETRKAEMAKKPPDAEEASGARKMKRRKPDNTPSPGDSKESTSGKKDAPSLEKLASERDEYLDHFKRERASFLNYKRRVEKERSDWENASVCRFVQKLLPFIDDLDRATKAVDGYTDVESLREGFEMICNRFQDGLKSAGVEEIPSNGEPFDPKVHEAVLQVEDPDQPEWTILETTHRGFRLSDRLIRPAKVVVSKVPQSSSREAGKEKPSGEDASGGGDEGINEPTFPEKE